MEQKTPQLNLRKLIIRTLVGLVVVFGALVVIGILFKEELLALSKSFVESLGAPGIALGLFIPDAFTVPLPHEAFLTFGLLGGLSFWEITAWGSLGSVTGGTIGYFIGRLLGRTKPMRYLLENHGARARELVERYGVTAVALGALTPIPYSITCWSSGALKMRFTPFFLASLLRAPRVAFYLWLIKLGLVDVVQ